VSAAPHAVTLLRGAQVVTPDGVLGDSAVTVRDGAVVHVGREQGGQAGVVHLDGGWLVPGFVDLHCHGGGAASFCSTDRAEVAKAARFHASHGTTTMLASLVSAPVGDLCRQLAVIADLIEDGGSPVVGSHLEGPFLSARHRGAQNPASLTAPDADAFGQLADAARGTLRMITIAPELPGANDVIDAALAHGVRVAIGHTDATYRQARDAFARGATIATHLFNGMRGIHHREPGPIIAALDFGAWCELISDGHHLHPAAIRHVAASAADRIVLITDAITAAGSPDGRYRLSGLDVTVRNGQAQLSDGSSLAGSTLTMDLAVRRAVSAGLSLPTAVAAASTHPAGALGLGDQVGAISPGRRADLVWLDDNLNRRAVMTAGRWTPIRWSW